MGKKTDANYKTNPLNDYHCFPTLIHLRQKEDSLIPANEESPTSASGGSNSNAGVVAPLDPPPTLLFRSVFNGFVGMGGAAPSSPDRHDDSVQLLETMLVLGSVGACVDDDRLRVAVSRPPCRAILSSLSLSISASTSSNLGGCTRLMLGDRTGVAGTARGVGAGRTMATGAGGLKEKGRTVLSGKANSILFFSKSSSKYSLSSSMDKLRSC